MSSNTKIPHPHLPPSTSPPPPPPSHRPSLLLKLYVDELADLADRLKVEMPSTSSWS